MLSEVARGQQTSCSSYPLGANQLACCLQTQKRLNFGQDGEAEDERGEEVAGASLTSRDSSIAAGQRLYQRGQELLIRQKEAARKLREVSLHMACLWRT